MLLEVGQAYYAWPTGGAASYSSLALPCSRVPRCRTGNLRASNQDQATTNFPVQQTASNNVAGSNQLQATRPVPQRTATAAAVQRRARDATISVNHNNTSVASKSQLPVYLGAAAVAAALVIGAYRTFLTGAAKNAAAAVTQGISAKRLQREAAARLNEMSSLLQNSPTADLSAKNLGDEGTAYVVEALAFNTVCLAADFSNNGVGQLGMAQLSEVLPTCALQHLKLHTNNIGEQQLVSANPHLF